MEREITVSIAHSAKPLVVLHDPPMGLSPLVLADAMGSASLMASLLFFFIFSFCFSSICSFC